MSNNPAILELINEHAKEQAQFYAINIYEKTGKHILVYKSERFGHHFLLWKDHPSNDEFIVFNQGKYIYSTEFKNSEI